MTIDPDTLAAARTVRTSDLSDALDSMGPQERHVMDPRMRPLLPGIRFVCRDSYEATIQQTPVFCSVRSPAHPMGRIRAVSDGEPIVCGGIEVRQGDLVVGDDDGVVVVPQDIAAEAVDRAVRIQEADRPPAGEPATRSSGSRSTRPSADDVAGVRSGRRVLGGTMIGGPGPTPNLLRQYELGKVPKEMAEQHDDAAGPHDEGRTEKTRKPSRRWWSRFLRRR